MAFPTNIVNRRLVRAMGWSVMLHMLVLWPAVVLMTPSGGMRGSFGAAVVRAPLNGRLHAAPAVAPALVQTEKPGRGNVLKTTGPARSPVKVEGRAAASLPSAAAVVADESAGIDAEDLRAYRMSLTRQARPYWRYPAEAQRAGEGGTVEVRVAFSSNGSGRVSLERTSGHRALDDAALQMLQAALASAVQPEALRGKSFSLVMPVEFEPGREAVR